MHAAASSEFGVDPAGLSTVTDTARVLKPSGTKERATINRDTI
jgi:hypothetical protein